MCAKIVWHVIRNIIYTEMEVAVSTFKPFKQILNPSIRIKSATKRVPQKGAFFVLYNFFSYFCA